MVYRLQQSGLLEAARERSKCEEVSLAVHYAHQDCLLYYLLET